MDAWGRRFVGGFVVPTVAGAVVLASTQSMQVEAVLQLAALLGLLSWCVVTIVAARRAGRPVPLAAVTVLACLVPVSAAAVGFYVTFAYSGAAGGWIQRAALTAFALAALTVLVALLAPGRRRLAIVGCVVVGVLPVVATASMTAVALTAEGRHEAALERFPVDGPPRAPVRGEDLAFLEVQVVTRVWDDAGVACGELSDLVEEWSGRPARSVEQPLVVPSGSCTVEALGPWTGRRAAALPDGRLVVSIWSPTPDLFSF